MTKVESRQKKKLNQIYLVALLAVVFLLGSTFRLIRGDEIEFKKDEAETLNFVKAFEKEGTWSWVGQPSSNGLAHPGLGIWLFMIPGAALSLTEGPDLARVTQVLGCLTLLLLLLFAFFYVPPAEREYWLWAFALASANPFQILLERRIWHPSLLPFFVLVTIMGWWKRDFPWRGAFLWGFVGALLGQIHMSGFFFTLGLAGWTYLRQIPEKRVSWKHWLGGSVVGALPLLPWIFALLASESNDPLNFKWYRLFNMRYWLYWVRNSFGWNSKFPLGEETELFFTWPHIKGEFSGIMAWTHFLLIAITGYFCLLLLRWIKNHRKTFFHDLIRHSNETRFLLNGALWGCGILATLSGINITRYFHLTVYPLPYLFVAYVFLRFSSKGRVFLTTMVIGQFMICWAFSDFIHKTDRELDGDYKYPYRVEYRPSKKYYR